MHDCDVSSAVLELKVVLLTSDEDDDGLISFWLGVMGKWWVLLLHWHDWLWWPTSLCDHVMSCMNGSFASKSHMSFISINQNRNIVLKHQHFKGDERGQIIFQGRNIQKSICSDQFVQQNALFFGVAYIFGENGGGENFWWGVDAALLMLSLCSVHRIEQLVICLMYQVSQKKCGVANKQFRMVQYNNAIFGNMIDATCCMLPFWKFW